LCNGPKKLEHSGKKDRSVKKRCNERLKGAKYGKPNLNKPIPTLINHKMKPNL
jgi:hypothetical protein